ncbi:MAG: ECF transporter S component [Clostridia bacterium]|nr:ECF transporter S component [Clostridia bacterium]
MEKQKFFSAKNIAILGVLLALVIVLQALGGSINIGAVQLNFTLIPIVLGALVLGPWAGAFLGLACGVVILIQVIMAPGGFYYIIWSYNPIITVITCLSKTTLAGLAAGFLFQLIEKKNRLVAVFVASGIVPIINTAVFVLCCLWMNEGVGAFQNLLPDFAGMNMFVFILVGLVTFNFFIEFGINLLVAPGIHTVYKVVEKRIQNR